jgi:hypothetical protein
LDCGSGIAASVIVLATRSQTRFQASQQDSATVIGGQVRTANLNAVEIFNLNLFASGAYLHFISKTQTRLFQVGNARRQILHLKKHTVPSNGGTG